jgi:hypothetical protein
MNSVYLMGIVFGVPKKTLGWKGETVWLFDLLLPPETDEPAGACEAPGRERVEVTDEIVEDYDAELVPGIELLLDGHLMGAGRGIRATRLWVGAPPSLRTFCLG